MENEFENVSVAVKPLKVVRAIVMGEEDYQALVARAEKAEAELAALYKLYEDTCLTITQDGYAYEVDRQALESELAAERERNRWVSVGERMPEDNQEVYAREFSGVITHFKYSSKLAEIFRRHYTHWQPPIEPPKEGLS